MEDLALSPLPAWEAFYVIIGSSAAALTGLQFVVIVLAAEARRVSTTTTRAFATPTIVHFCAVLLIAAILSAPWHDLVHPAVALGAVGAAGMAYGGSVAMRARQQSDYTPVFEDWLWHVCLPLLAHAALLAAAVMLPGQARESLFGVGASAVLLLFVGIHNAWDAVVYIALSQTRESEPTKEG